MKLVLFDKIIIIIVRFIKYNYSYFVFIISIAIFKTHCMKKLLLSFFFMSILFSLSANPIPKANEIFFKYHLQVLGGYCGGLNGQLNLILSDFAKDFPFALKIGFGHTSLNPGNALDARRIFINDATNGTPEKKGVINDGKLDFMYKTKVFKVKDSYLYAGLRYSKFDGNFNFVGGNEKFDVTSKTFGFGAGAEFHFPINKKWDLTANTGANYYLKHALEGHDTAYSPDGQDINPRNDYSYADADLVINQPKFQAQAVLGLTYKF
jgi:hypothetical protein